MSNKNNTKETEFYIVYRHKPLPEGMSLIASGIHYIECWGDDKRKANAHLEQTIRKMGGNAAISYEIESTYKETEDFVRAIPAILVPINNHDYPKDKIKAFKKAAKKSSRTVRDFSIATYAAMFVGFLMLLSILHYS